MSIAYTDLLLEAGFLINKAVSSKEISTILVEYANSGLKPDLSCFYQCGNKLNSDMELRIKRGFTPVSDILIRSSELSGFLFESQQLVCLNTIKKSPFRDLLLSDNMESGMAIAIYINKLEFGVLILNSKHPFYFGKEEIQFLERLCSIINKDRIRSK